jgi:hypothetical protein
VKDGNYGAENPDVKGGWDGMVGELVRKVRVKSPPQHDRHTLAMKVKTRTIRDIKSTTGYGRL